MKTLASRRVMRMRRTSLCRSAFVVATLLAPIATRADIASPPNDYAAFLSRGHYLGKAAVREGGWWFIPVLCGVCAAAGVIALVWLCTRRKEKKPVKMEYAVLSVLTGTAVMGGVLVCQDVLRGLDDLAYGDRSGHSRPKLHYEDTPELRAKYDRECIEYYENYRASTNFPRAIAYQLGSGAPIMRPNAPKAVTNAYRRYCEELKKTVFVPIWGE